MTGQTELRGGEEIEGYGKEGRRHIDLGPHLKTRKLESITDFKSFEPRTSSSGPADEIAS